MELCLSLKLPCLHFMHFIYFFSDQVCLRKEHFQTFNALHHINVRFLMSAPQTVHQPPEKPFCTFSPITEAEIPFKVRCLIKRRANLNKRNTFQLPHVYGAGVTGALRAGNSSLKENS